MLMDKLRDGAQGRVAKIIFWIIILSFSLAGIGSYLNRPTTTDPVKVDGEEISSRTLQESYQNARENLRNQYGPAASKLMDNPQYVAQLKMSVLNQLINQTLLNHKATKSGIYVSDDQVKQAILQMPEFQVKNQFNNDRFQAILGRVGYTPDSFAASVRQDLTRELMLDGLLNTDFVLPQELQRVQDLYLQTRSVKMYTINAAALLPSIKVTDDEAKTYYQAHSDQFMQPEMVKLNYVVLDADKLAKGIQPTDVQLETYYKEHADSFTQKARIKVAHILIKDADDAKAKAKAESILAQLQKGADFADLAKKNSADTLSARQGGVLDWFEKGVMDPAFEQAAFSLTKPAQLSGVVKSAFGYHIIKLIDKQEAKSLPFEQVKASVKDKYVQEQAKNKFADLQQKLSDSGFENPDSLDVVSQDLSLPVGKTDFISAEQFPAELNAQSVKDAAFNAKLRDENTNSDVLTISDSKVTMIHVLDYKPTTVKPFDSVKSEAADHVKLKKASELAKQQAAEIQAKLVAGQPADDLIAKYQAKVQDKADLTRFSGDLAPDVLKLVFQMPKDQKPVSTSVYSDPQGDASLIQLMHVGLSTDKQAVDMAQGLKPQLNKLNHDNAQAVLLEHLRQNADIKYTEENEKEMQ